MNGRDDKFRFSYSAPTENERREIDSIRRAYLSENGEREKTDGLLTRERKKRKAAGISSIALGIVGLPVFGLGLVMIMERKLIAVGAAVGIGGAVLVALACTVYRLALKKRRAESYEETSRLSGEGTNEREGTNRDGA